jgi:phage terminase large subunit-like protein
MNALPSLETHPSPLEFFSRLKWIDGRPLLETIEPYRRDLFMRSLFSFRDDGAPIYNMTLAGRGKKNFKSSDLVLAGLYCLLCLESPQGNECYIIANDLKQAGDDLSLAKKLVEANADEIGDEVEIFAEEIRRVDGRGFLQILPARDSIGAHGKTYLFLGLDEIHGWRDYDLLEAMAPDPTRPDTRVWITSYDTLFSNPGVPLYDLKQRGIAGDDPRMLFSWYSGQTCTDPDFAELEREYRANPSIGSWPEGIAYIDQQRRRLPSHKFRRLHLNLPGAPNGAFFDPDNVMAAIVAGRTSLPPQAEQAYAAFVDMSGGSSDDATLSIAHNAAGKTIVDLVEKQAGKPPFNPRLLAGLQRF